MSALRYDMARLKGAVGIAAVLAWYGLVARLRTVRGDLVGACPLPGHGGDRNNHQAFHASPTRGLWRCASWCGGGDVIDLVMHLEGAGPAAAARTLARIEAGQTGEPTVPVEPATGLAFRPYTNTLRLQHDHPLLMARGIRPDTARRFEAGFWPLGGFLERSLAVRLHDLDGRPLGYAARRLDPGAIEAHGKWRFPPGLPKGELLYNWHRARQHAARGLILVEGPWDAMRIAQAGFPNVVALLGTSLAPRQRAILQTSPQLVLALDADPAGSHATQRCLHQLSPTQVQTLDLPDGADPADLAEEDLRHSLSSLLACAHFAA